MTTSLKTRNLGQHARLLRSRRDSYVHATAVSVATLLMTHCAPRFDPQGPSLYAHYTANLILNPQFRRQTDRSNPHRPIPAEA
jgi:hypothetical protein